MYLYMNGYGIHEYRIAKNEINVDKKKHFAYKKLAYLNGFSIHIGQRNT